MGEFLSGLAAELQVKDLSAAALAAGAHPQAGQAGSTRPLGIPTVRDRVVMAAAKIVLEPVFEADFLPTSFGFRPKRSAHMAVEAIRVEANRGADWVLDADIKACFDQIDHDALMALVGAGVDRQMLKLLRCWLRAGVFESGIVRSSVGHPAGIANLPAARQHRPARLDEAWEKAGRQSGYWSGTPTTSSSSAPPGPGPKRLGPGPRRCWHLRVAAASREDPHHPAHPGQRGVRLPGLPPAQGGVLELAGPLLHAALAVGAGHGHHPRQGQSGDG